MSLFEFCIRRPVFATVLSLVLVLLGIVSYNRLTVREYPNVDEPVVSVSFSLPNFYFHATTAYDILRTKGVPLGKLDYLGQLRIKR
jgi:hypothetical protein